MTRTVTLSTGEDVEIRPINWRGFKALKNLIAKTVSGPVLRETVDVISGPLGGLLGDILQSFASSVQADGDARSAAAAQLSAKWSDAQTMEMILASLEQLKSTLANVLMELLDSSDQFTEMLIQSGTNSKTAEPGLPYSLDLMSLADITALRTAVLEENDIAAIFEMEKNWWGQVMSSGKALIGTPTSTLPGTFTTNIG